jgi:hypothetical protein
MELIRSNSAALLDAAMTQADELVEFFARIDSRLDADDQAILADAARRQESILRKLREDRRMHDDMPAVGDPERGELRAIATTVHDVFASFFDTDDSDAVVRKAVIDATESSRQQFEEIPPEALTDTQRGLVADYDDACNWLVSRFANASP